jgi:DNA-binding response OmpR family regulator
MLAHRVLIVDDEATLRRALRVGLAARGFEVMEAGNGNEALTIVAAEQCDAVLMDINMPELDGIEACRRIRHIRPALQILIISVRDGEEDKQRAFEAGANAYFTKPFTLREVIARLDAIAT